MAANLAELAERAKITIVSGPFGAGKTNIAVNIALALAAKGQKCRVADLDIVNPYFRSADNAAMLALHGVETLVPEFANTNVDIPALPLNYNRIFTGEGYSVCDVGGDADGAAVLGFSHREYLAAGCAMYFVYNRFRPLTAAPADALEMLRHIERVSGLEFRGIINNSNLGAETAAETVREGLPYAQKLAELSGLPLEITVAPEWLKLPGTAAIKDITKKLF
ncbi:MAG: cobalamin biosynthesis protein CobQ [Clostridia bacterium]|nr:cobalamin biosynthesis protein CobQ [Clostridia bacterium]MBR4799231.1 cobalamin biosynthesis protein CobQ [Clostridia bacterium]